MAIREVAVGEDRAERRGRLQREAYAAGETAGAGATQPPGMRQELLRHWEAGQAASAAARRAKVEHREPEVVHQDPVPEERAGAVWPKGRPLPTTYRRPPVPCPSCRRVLTAQGAVAARVTTSRGGCAEFRCVDCGHRWKLPRADD